MVALGASAGGLEAVSEFFAAMPADSGIPFLVVPHLDPDRQSRFAELIAQKTAMPVVEAADGERLQPDRVYVIPPDRTLTVAGGHLRVRQPAEPRGHRHPVDLVFRSLAEAYGRRAVAIVLSGTGSNGTAGLREVRGHGGLAVAQAPETAKFGGMPRSAIDSGVVDHVLPPAEMPRLLLRYARHSYVLHDGDEPPPDLVPEEELIEAVLTLLRRSARHDFRGYRRPTLLRRLHRRMGLARTDRLDEYLSLLRESPDETEALAEDLLIRVTGFFRDVEAWEALAEKVVAPLVAERREDSPIRAWVPGCATGEEAYSLAMLLLERVAAAAHPPEVRVFATDVSNAALARAREGFYAETLVAGLTEERLQRFFSPAGNGYRVGEKLRTSVVFAPHNLLADPPFSRLDLVSCRNLLIYLQPKVQERLLAILHLALVRGGYLLLGNAESVGQQSELFEPVSRKHRIFRRVGPTRHDLVSFSGSERSIDEAASWPGLPRQRPWARLAGDALLARHAPAAVLVDRRHHILFFHGETDRFLSQPAGEPTRDLLALARRGLAAPLRRALVRAGAEGEAAEPARLWGRADSPPLTISAAAVQSREAPPGLLLVSFIEHPPESVAAAAEPPAEVAEGQLEQELAAAREDLRRTVEDGEAAHEELKAAHEEVVSMNEELQSTNEELETSKEELQSLNEELSTVNSQLERKVEELEIATSDLNNLLASSDQATLFLDRELRIRRYTPALTRLVEAIPSDVGRPLGQLAATGATEGLDEEAEAVLASLVPREAEITADGHWYLRRVLPYRGQGDRIEGVVVTFADITNIKRAEREAALKIYAEAVLGTVREPLVVLTRDLEVRSANTAFYRTFGLEPGAAEKRSLFEIQDGQWDLPRLRQLLGEVFARGSSFDDFEIAQELGDGKRRTLLLNGRQVDEHDLVLLAIEDVTERRRHQEALRERDRAAQEVAVRERFLAALSHELRTPLTPALALVSGLRERRELDEGVRAELARVQRNLEQEVRLVDDLLDLSRISTGRLGLEPRTVDLTELVRQAAEVLPAERLDDAGLSLHLDLPEHAEKAWGDPARLTQVLRNLIVNATKFTPAGGSITLRLRRREDDSLEVSVTDTGVGIAAEDLPRVFDCFGAPREPAQDLPAGLGLGLSICRTIIEQHGGELTAASDGPGKGAAFTVRLPEMPEGHRDLEGEKAPPAEKASGKTAGRSPLLAADGPLRILVVEDHDDSRDVFVGLLEVMGHDVVSAGNRADALAVAAKRCSPGGAGLDLMICDLGLPDGNGNDLMREIVERHRLPGIAVTGYGRESDVRASLEAGFAAHLTKPVDVRKLRRAIQTLRSE